MSSKVERKLAAIMFTDIVGYTAQMSKDEAVAISLLNKKESILKPLIKEHNGTYVKSTGDGSLSHFNSAVDAAMCAKRLQESIYEDKDLNVRVGVHLGDTIFEKGDVRGDGVNIASRLESMAVEGGVFISKEVHDQLSNQIEFDDVSLGLQSMKGVGRLIEVFGLKGDKLTPPNPDKYQENRIAKHSGDEVPSVAIIPFENRGAEEDIFYAYGISADLISDCSSGGKIRVASQKEVEELDDISFKEKGKKLKCRYVCQGTLWKMKNIFQLTAELYDIKNSKVIWSDRWQENWSNLIVIKEKLSKNLLNILNTRNKTNANAKNISDTDNVEAYEYYLKGKYKIEKGTTPEDMSVGIELIKKSYTLDENLVKARFALMSVYSMQGKTKNVISMSKEIEKIAKKTNDKNVLAASYVSRAVAILMQSLQAGEEVPFNEIQILLKKADSIAMKNNNKKIQLMAKTASAQFYGLEEKGRMAIDILLGTIKIQKDLEYDSEMIFKTECTLIMNYEMMGDYFNAIKYLEAIKYSDDFTLSSLAKKAHYKIMLIANHDLDGALNHFQVLAEKSKNYPMVLQEAYKYIGLIYILKKEYSTAIDYLLKRDKIYEKSQIEDKKPSLMLTYAKKCIGKENKKELNELQKHIEIDNSTYWSGYYAFRLFGGKIGKKYLKQSVDIIEKMKLELEKESQVIFMKSHHVKLIINEWEKIND